MIYFIIVIIAKIIKIIGYKVFTKIFYKKDWINIKKNNSKWGAKDLWGDFDLLIGAYKNNLKIIEVPVTYFERTENDTKMNSLILNASRMLYIVLAAYYKLRLKK